MKVPISGSRRTMSSASSRMRAQTGSSLSTAWRAGIAAAPWIASASPRRMRAQLLAQLGRGPVKRNATEI